MDLEAAPIDRLRSSSSSRRLRVYVRGQAFGDASLPRPGALGVANLVTAVGALRARRAEELGAGRFKLLREEPQGAARRARASGTAGGAKAVKQLMRVLPHVELERKLQLLCDALELECEGRTHNHREGQRLSEELERLAQGISGTSNAFSEDFGRCSSYSSSGSGLSGLRRRVYGQASSKATTTRVPTEDHSESDEHPSVCGARAAHLRTTPQTA